MIASLPMYDRPETAAANNRLWDGVRDRLGEGPATLTRDGDVWSHWRSPALVLSQTCGYPYRVKLAGDVALVGTPVYDIDCSAGSYFSVFVVRRDDPRQKLVEFADARFAYNEALSQSGWAAPQNHMAGIDMSFRKPIQSGAHVLSAQMIAEGRADIAALDAISWQMMSKWDDFAKDLRVLGRTPPTPGLPLITSKTRDPLLIREAVEGAIANLSQTDRLDLCLTGMVHVAKEAYLAVPNPPSPQVT